MPAGTEPAGPAEEPLRRPRRPRDSLFWGGLAGIAAVTLATLVVAVAAAVIALVVSLLF